MGTVAAHVLRKKGQASQYPFDAVRGPFHLRCLPFAPPVGAGRLKLDDDVRLKRAQASRFELISPAPLV